jgi:pyridoxal phosphate enzyme (YggS family)
VTPINLAENLLRVKNDIERCAVTSGREANSVKLIAVSKTRSLEEVEAIVDLGQSCLGENTVQDAMTKIPHLSNQNIEWHYIGHLQSKKAGKLPGYFQWIHSVDSLKLAKKLSSALYAHSKNSVLNCLIQVNVSDEATKSGLQLDEVKPFIQEVLQHDLPCLRWRGLMTIGVRSNEEKTRRAFSQLRELQQACNEEFDLNNFNQLSMGMSNDYCMAIEEGATMVRVGTSIFGERS